MSGYLLFLWLAMTSVSEPPPQAVAVWQDGSWSSVQEVDAFTGEDWRKAVGVWVWSEHSAPQRVETAQGLDDALEDSPDRLRIRVEAPREILADSRILVAAPTSMWEEVPEELLPMWNVPESGCLEVPLNPGQNWRIRWIGERNGTIWTETGEREKTITLRPASGGDLTLHVTDEEGEPLDRARLEVSRLGPGRDVEAVLALARSGSKGELFLPSLPPTGRLLWMIQAPGHAPFAWVGPAATIPSRISLELGTIVQGRFVDGQDHPVPGVEVETTAWLSPYVAEEFRRTVTSDESGRFEVHGLPSGQVAVTAMASGFAPFRRTFEDVHGVHDLGDVVLSPSVFLKVLVTDDQSQPVSGAVVEVGSGPKTTTDKNGAARLEDLSEETPIHLSVTMPRHLTLHRQLSPPFPNPLRLILSRAYVVRGRLIDEDDQPVTGGRVVAVHRQGSRSSQSGTHLDVDGHFGLSLSPGKAHELTLQAPGIRDLVVPAPPGEPGEEHDLGDLRASSGWAVKGRVVDAHTGEAVVGANVWTPRPEHRNALAAWLQGKVLTTNTDSEGHFELSGLAPLAFLLRVESRGHARKFVSVHPEPGQQTLDLGSIRLDEGGTLQVRLDSEESSTDEILAEVDLRPGAGDVDRVTAAVVDGETRIEHVPIGTRTVRVLREQRPICEETVEIASPGEEVIVSCEVRRRIVEGTVVDEQGPAGSGSLTWHFLDQEPSGVSMRLSSDSGLSRSLSFGKGLQDLSISVDDGGRFRTEHLVPGNWEVVWFPDSGEWVDPQRVQVPDLNHATLTLEFAGLFVEGTVIDERGFPVDGSRVRESTTGLTAFSQQDGSFRLKLSGSGRRILQARSGDRKSPETEVYLVAGEVPEPIVLELEPVRERLLSIVVVGPRGLPVSGAFVFLETAGGSLRSLTTDRDGRAKTKIEKPQPDQLRAAAFTGSGWAFSEWKSWESVEQGWRLEIPESGQFAVESEEQGGPLSIRTDSGWDVTFLLSRLGFDSRLTPGEPLVLAGLPPMDYRIRLGTSEVLQSLRSGETVRVALGVP